MTQEYIITTASSFFSLNLEFVQFVTIKNNIEAKNIKDDKFLCWR